MWPVAPDELRKLGDEQMKSLITWYVPLLTDDYRVHIKDVPTVFKD